MLNSYLLSIAQSGLAVSQNATSTSDGSQLAVNLLTVAIAVASSSVAVVIGGFTQSIFKSRSRAKQTKSLVVAYVTRILEGLPNLLSFFQFFSTTTSWTESSIALVPILTKRMQSLDTSIYDTRIRDNLLFLNSDLANDVSFFDQLVRLINDYLQSNLTIITNSGASGVSQYLQQNSDRLVRAEGFVKTLVDTSAQFRTALLSRKKKMGIDWLPLLKISQEISTVMGAIPKSAISSS